MTTPISAYVLTYNSERHLDAVLERLARVADDLLVLDSGSTDATREIAERHGARFATRPFDDFISQRTHAASLCRHDWVLFVDSDEYLDDELIDALTGLKGRLAENRFDSYRLRRDWYVLGRPVHGIYPIKSPDFRVRLYRKDAGHFDERLPVHEKLVGLKCTGRVRRGSIHHHTFETREEFARKLRRYEPLAVEAMQRRGKKTGPLRARFHAVAAYLKWLLTYQCWRDGRVGLLCCRYAYDCTLAKYQGLLRHQRWENQSD